MAVHGGPGIPTGMTSPFGSGNGVANRHCRKTVYPYLHPRFRFLASARKVARYPLRLVDEAYAFDCAGGVGCAPFGESSVMQSSVILWGNLSFAKFCDPLGEPQVCQVL